MGVSKQKYKQERTEAQHFDHQVTVGLDQVAKAGTNILNFAQKIFQKQ